MIKRRILPVVVLVLIFVSACSNTELKKKAKTKPPTYPCSPISLTLKLTNFDKIDKLQASVTLKNEFYKPILIYKYASVENYHSRLRHFRSLVRISRDTYKYPLCCNRFIFQVKKLGNRYSLAKKIGYRKKMLPNILKPGKTVKITRNISRYCLNDGEYKVRCFVNQSREFNPIRNFTTEWVYFKVKNGKVQLLRKKRILEKNISKTIRS